MAKPTDTRDKLLQVAFDLIWNQSYGSVSVDQICERAHVNKGSFYHFFDSKSELAVEAYEVNWREKQPDFDRIFSPQNPPLERLLAWVEYVRHRQQQKTEKYGHVCGCPYASLGTELATQDEKIRAKSQEIMARTIRYIESALRDAVRERLISLEDTAAGAKRIYTAVLGLLLYAKVHNDLSVLAELESVIMDTVGVKTLAA
ncbi:MAG TPA: TetR/AcrR family transcriptional regulator [Verrucomicrobiae bacterium]|jgi:TetR/AcrR family transcriptional repressor of nem operon|nr:TetR/AcrR family transcriptional regulator [Verrucomicrobiae bacterium]